jgi:phage replication O-like protein O
MSVQLENGYIRIANEIWDEIIRRDFTKRQKDILLFIWRLSYGCNKKTATIPLLKYFELCGVTQNHIKDELVYLREMKVLQWDHETMVFSFNKDYTVWQARPVRKWNEDSFKELLHLNLTSQNRNFPKQELPKTGSEDFPKQEVRTTENPCGSKAEGTSKDSIKDIQEEEEMTALEAYTFSFKKHMYSGFIQGYVVELLRRGYTDAFVREVFLEMGERGTNPDVKYMRKVAEDWIEKGISTREEARQRKEEYRGGMPKGPKQEAARQEGPFAPNPIPMTAERWDYYQRLRYGEEE